MSVILMIKLFFLRRAVKRLEAKIAALPVLADSRKKAAQDEYSETLKRISTEVKQNRARMSERLNRLEKLCK